jgi:hypothetical protein
LAKLAIVQVIDFVKNERCFFTLTFFHENKIAEWINNAFGACHSHVLPKVLHFVKLSFWSSYSKLERQ